MQRVRILGTAAFITLGLLVFSLSRLGPFSWVGSGRLADEGARQDDVEWGGAARKSRAARYLAGHGGGAGRDGEPARTDEDGLAGKRGKKASAVTDRRGALAGDYPGDSASRRDWQSDAREWIAGERDFRLEARDPHADLRSIIGSPPDDRSEPREDPREEHPDDGSEDVVFQVPLNREDGLLATDSTAPTVEQNVGYPERGDGVSFGPDSVLAFPNAGNLRGDGGTLSLEIRPEWDGDDEGDFSLINVRTANDPANMLRVYKNGQYLRYIFGDALGREHEIGFDMSEWESGDRHSVAVTWDGSTTALYVDRQLVGENTNDGQLHIPLGTFLYVGSDVPEAPPTGAGGVISNLRVYGKALTGEVIAAAR